MTTVINTNIASQIAQNNLANTQNSLTQAITQLSSGLQINSAADNPAGQAIATLLQSQINGLTTAQTNANTGISLAQTGESALTQITNNLQTIRQLAVQASNGTNSAANRASLNQEAQQAIAQINTIASTTQFNGQNLLNGSFGLQSFQVGANAGQTVSLNLTQGVGAAQIGQTSSTTFQLGAAATSNLSTSAGTLTLTDNGSTYTVGTAVAGTATTQTADSAYAAAAAINSTNIVGMTATASDQQSFSYANVTNASTSAADTYSLTLNGVTINTSIAASSSLSGNDLVNAINGQTTNTGVTASLGSSGTINLSAADGRNITVAQASANSNLTGGLAANASAPTGFGTGGATTALAGTTAATSSGTLYGSVTISTADSLKLGGTVAATTKTVNEQAFNFTNIANSSAGAESYTLTLNGTAITSSVAAGGTLTEAGLITAINAQTATTGVTATQGTGGYAGELLLSTTNASSITVAQSDTATTITGGLSAATTAPAGYGLGGATTALTGGGTTSTASGTLAANATVASTVGTTNFKNTTVDAATGGIDVTTSGSLAQLSLTTQASAQSAIQTVDAALTQINSLQGQLGAVQNRFTSTIANLTASTQNASSAQSTIQDTNYATATAQLSRAQVLSQAATAIIAQANQLPNQVLKLLQ